MSSIEPGERSLLPAAVWLVPAAMLLIALADLPYGFYTLLRVVVCGATVLLVFHEYDLRGTTTGWMAVLAGIAQPRWAFRATILPDVFLEGKENVGPRQRERPKPRRRRRSSTRRRRTGGTAKQDRTAARSACRFSSAGPPDPAGHGRRRRFHAGRT